ncbi:MAG: hypothetical protein HYX41_06620 [Bdellovibrio sp.]|nr:hypothetical protein [Bdellovibrio sp.]
MKIKKGALTLTVALFFALFPFHAWAVQCQICSENIDSADPAATRNGAAYYHKDCYLPAGGKTWRSISEELKNPLLNGQRLEQVFAEAAASGMVITEEARAKRIQEAHVISILERARLVPVHQLVPSGLDDYRCEGGCCLFGAALSWACGSFVPMIIPGGVFIERSGLREEHEPEDAVIAFIQSAARRLSNPWAADFQTAYLDWYSGWARSKWNPSEKRSEVQGIFYLFPVDTLTADLLAARVLLAYQGGWFHSDRQWLDHSTFTSDFVIRELLRLNPDQGFRILNETLIKNADELRGTERNIR